MTRSHIDQRIPGGQLSRTVNRLQRAWKTPDTHAQPMNEDVSWRIVCMYHKRAIIFPAEQHISLTVCAEPAAREGQCRFCRLAAPPVCRESTTLTQKHAL